MPPVTTSHRLSKVQRYPRTILVGIAVFALLMLTGAVSIQVLAHQEPCPLCVLQRYACVLVAVLAGTAAAFPKQAQWHSPDGSKPTALGPAALFLISLMMVAALIGAGVAVRHTVVVWHPIVSCGIDVLQPMVNGLPTAAWFPLLFSAMGMCTNPAPLLGIPLPIWSLIGFVMIVVAGGTVLVAGATARK